MLVLILVLAAIQVGTRCESAVCSAMLSMMRGSPFSQSMSKACSPQQTARKSLCPTEEGSATGEGEARQGV